MFGLMQLKCDMLAVLYFSDTGKIVMKRQIPDTITEWVGNSICTSTTAGIGMAPQTGITAFQPFFLSFTLPYSAVRGEIVPVLVTVFNYMSDCLRVGIRLTIYARPGDYYQLHICLFTRRNSFDFLYP